MKAGHNEPDDIRMYDNDPRSPYYVEPDIECKGCDELGDPEKAFESETTGELFCSEECCEAYEKEAE